MDHRTTRKTGSEGTSFKAVALFLPALLPLFTLLSEVRVTGSHAVTIFDFREDFDPWRSIDDGVMGGLSQSSMTPEEGRARFEGIVSLQNDGGFASVRSRPETHDLSAFDGIALRVRGDGKTYAIRLRTSAAFDGVSYQTTARTVAGEWAELRLPFSEFRPVFRGREVAGSPILDPAEIKTFGLLIAERQAGAFRLELEWIRAYAD